jgi:hypothetical protein
MMADNSLIQLPGITTTEAPTPRLSPADIAAPYANLAHSMNAIGEGLTEEATSLAEEAGRKAVRTDNDGNLVVDKAPLIGPASAAYARAARMTALAKLEPQMQDDLTELRLKNPNNPDGFKTAAGAYVQTQVGQFKDTVLAGAVEKAGSEAAAHNYRTSLIETNHNQTAEALQAYQARIKDINEQTASLARQGGMETPEYIGKVHDRTALWGELAADGRFKFSKERVDLEIKEAVARDTQQAIIGEAQRIFQTKRNAAEAQKFLQDKMWDPRLALTAQQRDHGVAEGLHALAGISAQDRWAVAENKQAASVYITSMKDRPADFNDGMFNDMLQQSENIGDYRSADDLREAKRWQPVWQSLKGMGPDERAAALQPDGPPQIRCTFRCPAPVAA